MHGNDNILQRFIRKDDKIWSLYLLYCEGEGLSPSESFESIQLFLFWLIVHGRSINEITIAFPPGVLDSALPLDQFGCHGLMRYLAKKNNKTLTGYALFAWYYAEAVHMYRLLSFLTDAEVANLARFAAIAAGDRNGPATDRAWEHMLATSSARQKAPRFDRPPRVSIVGFHKSVLGIGEDARCLFDCLCSIGIFPELVDVSPQGLSAFEDNGRYLSFESARPSAPIVIFCLPAFETLRVIARFNLTRPAEPQYRIGYWPWETTALPEAWNHVYNSIDEIWASSNFLRSVYGSATQKPVEHMPLHVNVENPKYPEDLLSIFDFNSRIERKNPLGSIEAFRKAFPYEINKVQLILKTLHGNTRPKDLASVKQAIGSDDRIVIVDGSLSRAELCGLIALSNAYLSLHRSEGFGRPLVEAMLLDTPVVATQWSGSADFLDAASGFPVGSVLRPVRREEYPFAAGQWAEPDLAEAAVHMRQLYDAYEPPVEIIAAARRVAESSFGREAVAAKLYRRLKAIVGVMAQS
jgi:hypothetical protein